MRVVLMVIATLITLGLAAFGIVAAQKTTISFSSLAAAAGGARYVRSVTVRPPPAAAVRIAAAGATTLSSPVSSDAPAGAAPMHIAENAVPAVPIAENAVPAMPAPAKVTAPSQASPAVSNIPVCDKPGGIGLSRIVEIDTTGGPAFGFEHFKQYDFLRDKEVVLTFDDGPWPANTPAVLKTLNDNCLKATFFEIGEHATWHPELTKELVAAGETIGSHTWSHKDLARNPYASDLEKAKAEIEMGVSAVHMAAGASIAPFFRFPDLQHPPAMLAYLASRNIATFSTDIDSRDFKMHRPEQVIKSVMRQLERRGKGIVLLHDFRHNTAEALPELLRQLKAGGYGIVHMVPRAPVTTLPQYDKMVMQQDKLSVTNTRPISSVVRTIGRN